MGYTLIGIKTFIGMEGQGLNAVLCRDGEEVAFVLDEAQGGEMCFDFTNPRQNGKSYEKHKGSAAKEEQLFSAFVAKWFVESGERERWIKSMQEHDPEYKGDDVRPQSMMEDWVNDFVDTLQSEKRMKKVLGKKIAFTKKGKPGVWTLKAMPPEVLKQRLADPTLASKIKECDKVLNLLPLEEAVRVWKEADRA